MRLTYTTFIIDLPVIQRSTEEDYHFGKDPFWQRLKNPIHCFDFNDTVESILLNYRDFTFW